MAAPPQPSRSSRTERRWGPMRSTAQTASSSTSQETSTSARIRRTRSRSSRPPARSSPGTGRTPATTQWTSRQARCSTSAACTSRTSRSTHPAEEKSLSSAFLSPARQSATSAYGWGGTRRPSSGALLVDPADDVLDLRLLDCEVAERRLRRGRRGELRCALPLAIKGDPLARAFDPDHACAIELQRGAGLLEIDDEDALLAVARL